VSGRLGAVWHALVGRKKPLEERTEEAFDHVERALVRAEAALREVETEVARAEEEVASNRFLEAFGQKPDVDLHVLIEELHHGQDLDAQVRQLATAARHDPALLETYLVYADWLQSRGDPYGELIAIQYRLLTSKPTRELLRAEEKLRTELKRTPRPWPRWDAATVEEGLPSESAREAS
jgi:uncharacterized protein (TIGR02996 family)